MSKEVIIVSIHHFIPEQCDSCKDEFHMLYEWPNGLIYCGDCMVKYIIKKTNEGEVKIMRINKWKKQ